MVVALNQNDSCACCVRHALADRAAVGIAQSVNTATNPADPAIAQWFSGNAASPTTAASFQAASSIYPGIVPTAVVAANSAASRSAANALLSLFILAAASYLR